MVTIKDVANASGVSVSTVSRVLNSSKKVSPEVRENVLQSIKELNYVPNNAARTLVKKQTGYIAVLLRNLHSSFFSDLIRGMEDGAFSEDKNVFFCSIGKDPEYRDKTIQNLTNGSCDAIIMYGSLYSDRSTIEELVSKKFPFLLIENNFQALPVNQFLVNNQEGAYNAVDHLIRAGHKKIAYIVGDMNKKVNLERLNGYTSAMQHAGLNIEDDFVYNISGDGAVFFELGKKIMQIPASRRPTAVFCSSDIIAANLINGIIDSGHSVPADISVVGFDNRKYPIDNYHGPTISSVQQPLYEMGKDSISVISDIINGKLTSPVKRNYDTTFVDNSTIRQIKP